jgi:CDP-glucose 4,6-dehydratase
VLEPLSGYLALAAGLLGPRGAELESAWNFGPDAAGEATVGDVAEIAAACFGDGARVELDRTGRHPHEAGQLRLDSGRARRELGWSPRWTLRQALESTVAWHKAWLAGADMRAAATDEIAAWESTALEPAASR